MPNVRIRNPETEKYWRRVLLEWEESGLTQAEFCRKKNIRPSTFNHWKIEIAKRDLEKKPRAEKRVATAKPLASPSLFIPVVTKDSEKIKSGNNETSERESNTMQIVFAGGKFSLHLDAKTDRDLLRRIVTTLVDIKC